MLELTRIRAISIDLDDTLWPIWPTIERAERALLDWLRVHAPQAAALHESVATRQAIRARLEAGRPDLLHDLSALRLESIRATLERAGQDPQLAETAFEVFFAERQRVELFDDALPALEFLSRRHPLIALTNGNADVRRVGIGAFFSASISAHDIGVGKPDARIFQAAADAAGSSCAQLLHIGDDPALDALGALGAGLQAVWLNRAGKRWAHEVEPELEVADLAELCRHFED